MEEYHDLACDIYFKFICSDCNREFSKKKRRGARGKNFKFLCQRCGSKRTNIMKYGVDNPMKFAPIRDKAEQTNIKKYGVNNVFKSEEIKSKIKSVINKKYGANYPMQSTLIKAKSRETCLKKYGYTIGSQSSIVKEKAANTCIELYGVKCPLQNSIVRDKTKKTLLRKYGVTHFSQAIEFHKLKQAKFRYNNVLFDSSWELAFYIYYVDYNFTVIRTPCSIDYSYEGNEHKYFPDFKIQNRIFEIKGPQFFNEEGKLINPYDSSENIRAAAKHKCMLENNVIIITDCSKYLDYVNNKYGKDFLRSCRTENAEAV